MRIISSAFVDGGRIPSVYTCDGRNISPPLEFVDIPPEAKSLALIMEDPDVPKVVRADGMWDHWVLWNMQPAENVLPAGVSGVGVIGKNTSGRLAYGGPCPPDREHRYFFFGFALDKMLDLKEGASKLDLMRAMQGHVCAKAQLMGRYERTRDRFKE